MMELLGGGSDTTRADTQILYEYLQSQPLVERVDGALDLRGIYNDSRADTVFRFGDDPSIEGLVEYWNLAQTVSYDSAAGILYVEIRAFDPDDAQAIATALVTESERLINDLSAKSRRDAIAFALADLHEAETRVRDVRIALQTFRSAAGTADVSLDIQSAMSLVSSLRERRADIAADFDSRKQMLRADSPTLLALGRQLDAVDEQIALEEARIASAGSDGSAESGSLADAAGMQENLLVERQFAENMYTAALAAVESARAEARRAQRYLAIHIEPTRSDAAEHPRRWTLSIALGVLCLVLWSIVQLIASSIRDRS
jgi:capsular polysaccharide transport system permease protein